MEVCGVVLRPQLWGGGRAAQLALAPDDSSYADLVRLPVCALNRKGQVETMLGAHRSVIWPFVSELGPLRWLSRWERRLAMMVLLCDSNPGPRYVSIFFSWAVLAQVGGLRLGYLRGAIDLRTNFTRAGPLFKLPPRPGYARG